MINGLQIYFSIQIKVCRSNKVDQCALYKANRSLYFQDKPVKASSNVFRRYLSFSRFYARK